MLNWDICIKDIQKEKDAVSLLIYLANKGYLSIKDLPGKEIDLIGSRGFVIEKSKRL